MNAIINISPQFLIKGVSSYINNAFAESLINNWLSIEQLIDFVWERKIVGNKSSKKIAGRIDFLKDNRTWTTSAKVEVFYQLNFIDENLYEMISLARKTRNYFIHTGRNPTNEQAQAAFKSLFNLLSLCITDFTNKNYFDKLISSYEQLDQIRRTFYDKRKTEFGKEEIDYWLDAPIPPVPGDDNWKGEEYKYDIGFDFDGKK